MKSNYDKYPQIKVDKYKNDCWSGWDSICKRIVESVKTVHKKKVIVVVECYHGVNDEELIESLQSGLNPDRFIAAKDCYLGESEIDKMTFPDVTNDRIFGFMSSLKIENFIDLEKRQSLRNEINFIEEGLILLYGTGASILLEDFDLLMYADMARWEIQKRMRKEEVANLGVSNYALEISRKYKRSYFVDWRVCDKLKVELMDNWDFVLDTNVKKNPKMVSGKAIRHAMQKVTEQPFRLVPFFDPGPWGGQWMKDVCDLDKSVDNFAWCFDCVPEENSIVFAFGDTFVELPSINLVFSRPENLLGKMVYERFGAEFPIRFDFLDTFDGGNLSLQVHPLTDYIKENFGLNYTQDESYYMLDVKDGASVYLGLKEEANPSEMISDLQGAQKNGVNFDADKYIEKWAAKKHDHFLIPAGTVHCSGKDSMVLEISATPYIFTFKLWDWGRNGLDGKPRPINIEHGEKVIQWDRTTNWTKENLINRIEKIDEGDGWLEERTGLHETEFIETRRHWFSKKVLHDTAGNLNVLNLVEGREAIVESPENAFEPFVVHYAETFIIPATVGKYTIRPHGEASNKQCATLKAYVRGNHENDIANTLNAKNT